jgi:hypothetical protein
MPLYRALQAVFNRNAGSFANVEFGANVGKRKAIVGQNTEINFYTRL